MEISFFEVGKSYTCDNWSSGSYFTVKYVGDTYVVADADGEEVAYNVLSWLHSSVKEFIVPVPVSFCNLYRDGSVGQSRRMHLPSGAVTGQVATLVHYSDGHWELEELS